MNFEQRLKAPPAKSSSTPVSGCGSRSAWEAVDARKLLAESLVDRGQVDATLDEAALEDLPVSAPALIVAVRPGGGIVSSFVCAQMLSSPLQNEPEVFAASR